jgi:hypothetical protein
LALSLSFVACDGGGGDDDSSGDDAPLRVGCDDAVLEAAVLSLGSWSLRNSCAHFFSASMGENDFRLAISFNVPDTTMESIGMSFVLSLDARTVANQIGGSLEVQTGEHLSHFDCMQSPSFDDVLSRVSQPVVAQQWDAVAGTATMVVTSIEGDEGPGGPILFSGDVVLSGVTVELLGNPGTICVLPDTTWADQAFGWNPS